MTIFTMAGGWIKHIKAKIYTGPKLPWPESLPTADRGGGLDIE